MNRYYDPIIDLIASETIPITAEEVQYVVRAAARWYKPDDEFDEFIARKFWLPTIATGNWLKPLFQLLEVVDEADFACATDFTDYEREHLVMLNMLSFAARKEPERAITEAMKYAPGRTRPLRSGITCVIGDAKKAEHWPLLETYLENDAPKMSWMEAMMLAHAIADLGGPECLTRLYHLRDILGPKKMADMDMKHEFEVCLQKASGKI